MKGFRFLLILGLIVQCYLITNISCAQQEEDDDFAEFDDEFDDDPGFQKPSKEKVSPSVSDSRKQKEEDNKPPTIKEEVRREGFDEEEDGIVEDDFDSIDDDDFEDEGEGKKLPPPKLTITNSVPVPNRGWQGYWAELLMLSGIAVYMINYVLGRYKNQKIAQSFFDINWNLLEDNFALLGDTTKVDDEQGNKNYQKISDSIYQMWCSGRVCCEGMLVELKLLKRQDLVSILSNIFRPTKDTIRLSVEMGDDMDSLIFCLGTKKVAAKISKEYNDLINYCTDKKAGEKYGLPSQFVVMTEIGEVASAVLDARTCAVINKYEKYVESIHISDQFTGLKSTEPEMSKDGIVKLPEPRRYLFFTFVLPTSTSGGHLEDIFEDIKPLLQFVLHTIDRMKRVRLTREGKMKADKNRAKVEEAYMKQTHAARAEAMAAKREEKRRQEKEKILLEPDPEKQRRWEEKEMKREKKRKQPKMKQLKVKAL